MNNHFELKRKRIYNTNQIKYMVLEQLNEIICGHILLIGHGSSAGQRQDKGVVELEALFSSLA